MALPVRPRRPAPPLLFGFFCTEWLGLTPSIAKHWWEALRRGRWSRPVALRTVFLCRAALGSRQGAVRHFVTTNVTPPGLIGVLQDLCKEQLLDVDMARQIEAAVLAKTHATGMWK